MKNRPLDSLPERDLVAAIQQVTALVKTTGLTLGRGWRWRYECENLLRDRARDGWELFDAQASLKALTAARDKEAQNPCAANPCATKK